MARDASIIQLCRQGHAAGFARLVEAYQERVYRTAYAFVQHREDAQDLTQEVFLRAVRAIDSLDDSRPLWPWLRRVTTKTGPGAAPARAGSRTAGRVRRSAGQGRSRAGRSGSAGRAPAGPIRPCCWPSPARPCACRAVCGGPWGSG